MEMLTKSEIVFIVIGSMCLGALFGLVFGYLQGISTVMRDYEIRVAELESKCDELLGVIRRFQSSKEKTDTL